MLAANEGHRKKLLSASEARKIAFEILEEAKQRRDDYVEKEAKIMAFWEANDG